MKYLHSAESLTRFHFVVLGVSSMILRLPVIFFHDALVLRESSLSNLGTVASKLHYLVEVWTMAGRDTVMHDWQMYPFQVYKNMHLD